MKKIKDFIEKDSLKQPLLVKSVIKGVTQKGAQYATIIFQDNSGTIDGKVWTLKPEIEEVLQVGKIVDVKFEVLLYNKQLQLKVQTIQPLEQSMYQMSDYILASSISKNELEQSIKKYVISIKNEIYAKIVKQMLNIYWKEYLEYPAASKNHHSFLGGLATHTLGMLDVANSICELYPQLNRDLLISGVIIHDIGKLIELSGPITTEYTLEGKLIGHISIGHAKLYKVIDELQLQDHEEAILLRHMILSHHGHLEFGSPVLPLLQEAEVLSMIDNLDARLNTLQDALSKVAPGEFTQRIFPLENRMFYKPHQD